ncbi:MAG: methionyl-tRNA formyltransferase [Oscillospiraceae bacterium]|nr:methionyl-tRNA formyltransferase [Oscillospiraceae bacterium]
MRIVFMGTPDIAATCLRRLIAEDFEIVGVYTKPDKPKNRGMKLETSDVKKVAVEAGLPVFQPTTFKDDAVVEELRALRPDVIAVVAYGKILPQRVLDIARLGCVNIHASVLPALRGSGPVQWAILNGMDETGVTAMFMSAEMDAGDIIEIRKTPIEPFENAQSLLDRLALIGSGLLCDTLRSMEAGTVTRTPQEHDKATFAPMLTKELCPIDWTKSSRQIIDHVRGLDPWPVATTELGGTRFKIYEVRPADQKTDKAPGTLLALTKQGLQIAVGGGDVLTITVLQADGGKRMAAPDYFRGHPITI